MKRFNINESALRHIVKESLKTALKEELSSDEMKQKYNEYKRQTVCDKFDFITDGQGIEIKDLFDIIVDILGIEQADNLAERLLDEFDLRKEYEQEDEYLVGGYDRKGNPTVTYVGCQSGKRSVPYDLH